MLHKVYRKSLILCVFSVCLAVVPWPVLVVYDLSVLVVLLAEWSPGSKEGNGVDPVDAGKEEPGNQKPVYSLLSKLSFRSTIESVEGRDAREEEEHRHLPNVHEHHP